MGFRVVRVVRVVAAPVPAGSSRRHQAQIAVTAPIDSARAVDR